MCLTCGRQRGAAKYQKLVDDLNPATGVVQSTVKRADIDALKIPVARLSGLSVNLSAKEAQDAMVDILRDSEKLGIERNRLGTMLKDPTQCQLYIQRLVLAGAFNNPAVADIYTENVLRGKSAALTGLIADTAKAALSMREKGQGKAADTLGQLVSNIGDYSAKNIPLQTAISRAADQSEAFGDFEASRAIASQLSAQVVYNAQNKNGRKTLNSDSTLDKWNDYLSFLTSGISHWDPAGDMLSAQSLPDLINQINSAFEVKSKRAGLSGARGNRFNRNARIRELENKRRREGLTRWENDELTQLEEGSGQQFMSFFQQAKEDHFALEQEAESRGLKPAPPEQLQLIAARGEDSASKQAAQRIIKLTGRYSRESLPQVPTNVRGSFARWLTANEIPFTLEHISAADLSPTQNGVISDKVDSATKKKRSRNVIVSSDNEVIDGHHQWYVAKETGNKIPVTKLGISTQQAISALHQFQKVTGLDGTKYENEEYQYLGKAEQDWRDATHQEAAIVNPIDPSLSPDEKVDALNELSKENIPLVEKILADLNRKYALTGKYSVKLPERIQAKASRPSIREEKPWHDIEHVRDGLRFKVSLEHFKQVVGIAKTLLDNGAKIIKLDTKKMFEPKSWGWRFVAFDLQMPNGQLVEFYAPVPEMDNKTVKGPNHELFEKWRNVPMSQVSTGSEKYSEYKRDVEKSSATYGAAFDAALARMRYAGREAALADWNNAVNSAASLISDQSLLAPNNASTVQMEGSESSQVDDPERNIMALLGPSTSFDPLSDSKADFHGNEALIQPSNTPEAANGKPQFSARKRQDDLTGDLFANAASEIKAYSSALEKEGITAPTAKAQAAVKDLGVPAQAAFDLFGENPLTNPAEKSIQQPKETNHDNRNSSKRDRSPQAGGSHAEGTGKLPQQHVLGDLFDIMVSQRAAERDSGHDDSTSRALPTVDGQQSLATGDRHGNEPDGGSGSSQTSLSDVGRSGDDGRGDRGGNPAHQKRKSGNSQSVSPRRVERPPVGSPERNFSFTRDAELSPRGTVSKLRANLDAIGIIKTLDNEKRLATADEKERLAKFSGWGSLSQAFDDDKAGRVTRGEIETRRETARKYRERADYGHSTEFYLGEAERQEADAQRLENWKNQWFEAHQQIKSLLSDSEYRTAQRSTINAHYTSPEIIGAMWDMAEWLGFKGGNILEPGAGTGNFFGLMPESIADRSKMFGVELDAYTSKITKALYPEVDMQNTGFQTADIADNSIDLAISNVPFANVPVNDAALEAMGGPVSNLHDYFFGKAITKLKPGGIQMFITSAFTMDKGNPEIRKWLSERADLVAAYRLPNDAFKANAGTDVVTDIIILRKKDGKHFPQAQDWSTLDDAVTQKGEPIRINQYFVSHPSSILGLLDNDGSMFAGREGDKKEMTVHSDPNRPAKIALQQEIAALPKGIIGAETLPTDARTGNAAVKMGNIVLRDGKYFFQGQENPDPDLNNEKNIARVERLLPLRDALNRQYDLELSETSTDEEIEDNRRDLNRLYDAFTKKFAALHSNKNKSLFLDDPDYFRLLGAEVEAKQNRGAAAIFDALKERSSSRNRIFSKADVFTKRVLTPRVEPTRADTVNDAYGISLGWRGKVDIGFMSELTGKSPQLIERELVDGEIALRDPDSGQIQSREQYLSGNVRKKLAIARAAGPDYKRHVALLEAAQPDDVGIKDINFNVGSTWIPPQVYTAFLKSIGIGNVDISYTAGKDGEGGDSWSVNDKKMTRSGVAYKDYEVTRMGVTDLLESLLNLREINIYSKDEKGKSFFDMTATMQARDVANKINDKFVDWARAHETIGPELAKTYNWEVNAFTQRTYDGQFLQFPWANKDFDIFPDKKNTIWRAIQEGHGLIAHGVGGGKTIIGSAIALEMRRLGMSRKPMIVVHNSTLEGFAAELAKMAPSARVLVGRKDELVGDKRREFLMRIAAGDWDAVVVAHSTFGMIQDDPKVETDALNSHIDAMMETLNEQGISWAEATDKKVKKTPTVKNLVKMIERMEAKILKAQEKRKSKTDEGLLNFQQLGVDALIVDEAHLFKKMPFSTKQEAKGIDGQNSDKGLTLLMRARDIQSKMGGKNVFTMTGTPVTNTLGEIWNMVRLVAPQLVKEYKIEHFDQFLGKFGKIETVSEMGANGEYKNVRRLSKIINLPEWGTLLRMAADVKLGENLEVKNRPGIKGGKPELVAVERSAAVSVWIEYIKNVLKEYDGISGKEIAENPKLTAIPVQTFMSSRAAAIDIRLIDPQAKDDSGSKVNQMVDRFMQIYTRTTPYNGAQVIFADSFNQFSIDTLSSYMSPDFSWERDPSAPATFNLYQDIKSKLIALGVPENEIAIITDSQWNDAKKKQALFEMVNAGKIRVIMGSTQKLGTGVNMQERMAAAHHLDVPWTPAELEQRDGRVYRQGNIHGELGVDIELIRYGMKDTLDEALWQKLVTKQKINDYTLSGKIKGREIDQSEAGLTYAEQQGVLGGKLGQEKFDLESRLNLMAMAKAGYEREASSRALEIEQAKNHLRILVSRNARVAPSIEKMQMLAGSIQKDGSKISVDGKTFDTKSETQDAINSALEKSRSQFELTQDGRAITPDVTSISINGTPVFLKADTSFSRDIDENGKEQISRKTSFHLLSEQGDWQEDLSFGTVTSAGTLMARAEELGDTTSSLMSSLENNTSRLRELSSMKPAEAWSMQAEYDAMSAKLADVVKAINEEAKAQSEDQSSARRRENPDQQIFDFDAIPDNKPQAESDSEKTALARFQAEMPQAMRIASRYSNIPGVDRAEVEQTARISLAKASRQFDPSRGKPFGAMAGVYVNNALRSLYKKEDTRRERFPQSLDDLVGSESGGLPTTRADFTEDTNATTAPVSAASNESRQLLESAISKLPPKMQEVVQGFSDHRTLADIAGDMGVTKQAVSQLQKVAFDKLRRSLGMEGISSVDQLIGSRKREVISESDILEKEIEALLAEINAEADDYQNAALAEEASGAARNIGRPDLAHGADNADVRGIDQLYTDKFTPDTEKQWEADAAAMLKKDYAGTKKAIENAGFTNESLSPAETKAADQIARNLREKMLKTGAAEDRSAFNVFWYAYRKTGTSAGRAMAARRDPFKSHQERYRDFLLDLMLSPRKAAQKAIDAESDPKKKAVLIDTETQALLAKLKAAGISPDDILKDKVALSMVYKNIRDSFRQMLARGTSDANKQAFDAILKNKSFAAIAKMTGISEAAVKKIKDDFISAMRKDHFAKFKAGAKADGNALITGKQVDDATAEREFKKFLANFGIVDDAIQGKPKFDISDPAHVIRMARAIQASKSGGNILDMAYEWWIMNILSGPMTNIANIVGNSAMAGLDLTLQRGMEALVNLAVRDPNGAQFGEFKYLRKGIMPGVAKGLAMGARAWSAEQDFFEHTVLGTPMELNQWDKLGGTHAAIPGAAGRVIRIPGRSLLFTDSAFKTAIGQMEAGAFAYRIAKSEGFKGAALEKRVELLSKTRGEIIAEYSQKSSPPPEMIKYFADQLCKRNPSLNADDLTVDSASEAWTLAREQHAFDAAKKDGWNEKAWEQAVERARELTFQQDLKTTEQGGNIFEDVANKVQQARFGNKLIAVLFPFVRTPYNVFRQGIRKSPLGSINLATQAMKGLYSIKNGRPYLEGHPTAVRDLAEQLIAWMTFALLYRAIQGDADDDTKMLLITGSQPMNMAKRGERDLNSRVFGGEYVVRIGGRGGLTIPYGRIEPASIVLGTVADIIRGIKRNEPTGEKIASVWNYMLAQADNKTFLQGFATISDLIQGKNDPVGAIKKMTLQAIVPNLIRAPLRAIDDYTRDTKHAGAEYTLFPSGALAEPNVDPYGNEIKKGSNPLLRIFFNSPLATDETINKTDALLINWNRENPHEAYAPESPSGTYKKNGKNLEMTAEQTHKFRLLAGRLASSQLKGIVNARNSVNPTKADIDNIKKAFESSREQARERIVVTIR